MCVSAMLSRILSRCTFASSYLPSLSCRQPTLLMISTGVSGIRREWRAGDKQDRFPQRQAARHSKQKVQGKSIRFSRQLSSKRRARHTHTHTHTHTQQPHLTEQGLCARSTSSIAVRQQRPEDLLRLVVFGLSGVR